MIIFSSSLNLLYVRNIQNSKIQNSKSKVNLRGAVSIEWAEWQEIECVQRGTAQG